MSLLDAVLLGILQGLTEFIPVSSSGHLVVAQGLIPNFHQPGVLFDALLHLGTLFAVVFYYKKDLAMILTSLFPKGVAKDGKRTGEGRRLLWFLILGTIPTGIIGVLVKDRVEELFKLPRPVGFMLFLTGALLLLTDRVESRGKGLAGMRVWKALLIGIVQGLAIVPGVSRSGATIATGILLGFRREFAMEFSFLLAVPAVFGAVIIETMGHLPKLINDVELVGYLLGMGMSGFVGYLTIGWLLKVVQLRRLVYFGVYCWIVGALIVVFL